MEDIRIIYISKATFPNKSANSIHLMKMTRAISKLYSNVILVGFKSKLVRMQEKEIYESYNVEPTFKLKLLKTPKRGISFYYEIYILIWLFFKSRSKHIIYGRDLNLINFASILGFRVILESHDFFYSKARRSIEQKLFNRKNFLKLVVISKSLQKDYLDFFQHLNKIEVHHDAADVVNEIISNDISWPSTRQTLQIGYFGHLYKGRGIEIIIETAKALENFDFHIIGGNSSDIEKYKRLSLSNNLYFHGFKEQKELSILRSKCDILLMPYQKKLSIYNSDLNTSKWMSPMKLFEYMSSKKAIISSDLPVLREILNDSNSILVNPDNVSDWVNAIVLLSDKELREKLAHNAYKDFINKYTWTKRAENIFNGFIE